MKDKKTKKKGHPLTLNYLGSSLSIAIGLVFIWRGIWHILDMIEITFFNGDKFYTSLIGILIGILILYTPDKDLKELQKL
jgi:uncharacterized membrane protein HdeD (DUF308 family)